MVKRGGVFPDKKIIFLLSFIFLIPLFLHLLTASLDTSAYNYVNTINSLNFTSAGAIYGSPIISNGFAYFQSSDGNFYQLNASDLSSFASYSTQGSLSTPAVFGDFIYIRGENSNLFYQLNASNVSQQFATYPISMQGTKSTPLIYNNSVYIGDSSYLYQLNASNISQQLSNFTDSTLVFCSPKYNNGFIYATDSLGNFYQLNSSNISQQIATSSGIIVPSPLISGTFAYTGGNNYFYQLNSSNISQQIASYGFSGSLSFNTYSSTPAISNDSVYIATGSSCAKGCNDSFLYELNASNISQQIANYSSGYQGTNVWGPPTVYGNYVYIGNRYHILFQLNATDLSYISNYTTVGAISTAPIISGGFVYVSDEAGIFYQLNITNIATPIIGDYICDNWGDCSGGIQTRSCHQLYLGSIQYTTETQTCSTGGHLAPQPQPQPSGGGGGSVTIYRPIVNVSSAAPVQITINSTKMDLTGITLSLKKSVENASMNITKVDQTEFLLFGLPIGKLYQLFQIEPTGIVSSDILNATLDFRINKTFLAENNITFHHRDNRYWLVQNDIVGNIAVYRMPTGSNGWMQLATNYTGEDNESYLFKAYTPGFSTFAIFFNKYDCLPNSARCSEDEVQLCLGNATWLVTDHCADTCDNGKCTVSFYKSGQFKFLIGTILTGIFAIVLIRVIHNRRKKIKKELTRKERREIRKNKRKIKREMRKKIKQ